MEELISKIGNRYMPTTEQYVGEDGFLHCAVCHEATQTEVDINGVKQVLRCVCACERAKEEAAKKAKEAKEIEHKREICFAYANDMKNWNFANDDRRNEKMSNAMRNYAEQFPEWLKKGKGLLLYGKVGTGKTYYAACVANRVIEKGYRALMTNFAQVANKGTYEEKQKHIDELNRFHLIIFDDLGAERKSEYMKETVFNVVDTRYRARLPFIVTTNLSKDEFTKAQDVDSQRIYDRILERCYPVEVLGGSRRRTELKESYADFKAALGL